MKLFIWNLEYTVVFAIADTLMEAKELIKNQNKIRQPEVKALHDDMFDENLKMIHEKYLIFSNQTDFNYYMSSQNLNLVLQSNADIELPVDKKFARIYQHANE
jgi:hypothetical protein